MNAGLQHTIGRLERQKAELLQWIEQRPHGWLAYKPTPVKWSALEVLDHLRKAELVVLHSCKENLKSQKHLVTPSERAKAILFLTIMRLPTKVRVPEAVSFVRPDPVTSLQAVLESWAAERALLKAFFGSLPTSTENVGLVFHPTVGWMNLRTVMSFLSVHLRHHEYQLRRIKKACGRIRTEDANHA